MFDNNSITVSNIIWNASYVSFKILPLQSVISKHCKQVEIYKEEIFLQIEAVAAVWCAQTRVYLHSKKKRCKIRFRVVCFIDQIGRAHRNRYKYYYFPRVIVLSTVSSLTGKTHIKRLVYFTNNDFLCSIQ